MTSPNPIQDPSYPTIHFNPNPVLLVIDDDPDNFYIVEEVLQKDPYKLHYANTGEIGMASLSTYTPDLILLDLQMPGIDGIEVCRRIKSHDLWKTIPIMMITAMGAKETLAQCLEAGADDFISKPVNSIELRARVKSLLRIKAQYDHIQSQYAQIQSFTKVQRDTINLLGQNLHGLTGNLARNFPHELNTPLNGIIGIINFLQTHLDTLDTQEIYDLLTLAETSATRLERLTNKFMLYLDLELSRVRGSESSEVTAFPNPNLQKSITKLAEVQSRTNDIRWVESQPIMIKIPNRNLTILFTEILENALKFSHPHTPIKITTQISQGTSVTIDITDLGQGLTPEQLSHITMGIPYTPEYTAINPTFITTSKGIGMGLNLVRQIINAASGSFSIHSDIGQGTSVQIRLPIVPS